MLYQMLFPLNNRFNYAQNEKHKRGIKKKLINYFL